MLNTHGQDSSPQGSMNGGQSLESPVGALKPVWEWQKHVEVSMKGAAKGDLGLAWLQVVHFTSEITHLDEEARDAVS